MKTPKFHSTVLQHDLKKTTAQHAQLAKVRSDILAHIKKSKPIDQIPIDPQLFPDLSLLVDQTKQNGYPVADYADLINGSSTNIGYSLQIDIENEKSKIKHWRNFQMTHDKIPNDDEYVDISDIVKPFTKEEMNAMNIKHEIGLKPRVHKAILDVVCGGKKCGKTFLQSINNSHKSKKDRINFHFLDLFWNMYSQDEEAKQATEKKVRRKGYKNNEDAIKDLVNNTVGEAYDVLRRETYELPEEDIPVDGGDTVYNESTNRRTSPSMFWLFNVLDRDHSYKTDKSHLIGLFNKWASIKNNQTEEALAQIVKVMPLYIEFSNGNVNSEAQHYTNIRKAIHEGSKKKVDVVNSKIEGGHIKGMLFGISKQKKVQRAEAAQSLLAVSNTTTHDFMLNEIISARIKLMGMYPSNPTWISKVLLVQLCVGSRFIEVLKISDFYGLNDLVSDSDIAVRHMSPNSAEIVVHKVAKDKNNDKEDSDYNSVSNRVLDPKPCMFLTPAMVRYFVYRVIRPEALAYLNNTYKREEKSINAYDNKTITSTFSKEAIRVAREVFGDGLHKGVDGKLLPKQAQKRLQRVRGTHTMRKIYANMSYDLYGDRNITRNAWITKVLGHSPRSVTTSLSYTGVSISSGTKTRDSQTTDERLVYLTNKVDALESRLIEMSNMMSVKKRTEKLKGDVVALSSKKRKLEDDIVKNSREIDLTKKQKTESRTVTFTLANGEKATVPRWQRISKHDETKPQRAKRMDDHIKRLHQQNIPITKSILYASGVSQQTLYTDPLIGSEGAALMKKYK